jgi:diphthine-ammonia ligase
VIPETVADTPAAVLWSGGKDSTLALYYAQAAGLTVTTLFNLYDDASGRVRFHGVRRELVAAQADAAGLELLQLPTTMQSYEATFQEGLRQLRARGIGAIILGNIHLADVRAWYEERTTAAGLIHIEPLWDMPPARVVREVIRAGFCARITGIELARAPRAWLGRDIDEALADEFAAAGIDEAGESGEYHSFVYDGPMFTTPVPIVTGAVHEEGGFAFIDLESGQRRGTRVRTPSSSTRPGRGKL